MKLKTEILTSGWLRLKASVPLRHSGRALRNAGVILLLVALFGGGSGATVLGAARDRFGGWRSLQGGQTGYFHVEQLNGVWWLITPEGNVFLSKGVNNINYAGDHSPALGYSPYGRQVSQTYGSAPKWAAVAAQRLRSWGLNTVGAWSSPVMAEQQMPYTPVLNLAANAGANWLNGEVADVFSPEFALAVRQQAEKLCKPHVQDPFLLGYFTDNELRWAADWRSKKTLFQDFLSLPTQRPGKQAALRSVHSVWPDIESFNKAWGTSMSGWDDLGSLDLTIWTNAPAQAVERHFLKAYATAYFRVCHEAIRAVDTNHMILGCRFAGYAPEPVMESMSPFVDLVSYNNYGVAPPIQELQRLYRLTGKPVALTEFAFKAQDSGLPNTKGAGKPVATQRDRANHFASYVTALLQLPFSVGYHWFEYADEPAEGRFDGENSNYGLVNLKDEPWTLLVSQMTELNAHLEALHLAAGKRSE